MEKTGAAYSNMVNPDHVGVVDGDGVTTPDVLGVDVGDGYVPVAMLAEAIYQWVFVDILDDNVAGTADDTKTLAHDGTLGALSDDSLIRGDGDTQETSFVTVDSQFGVFLFGLVKYALGNGDRGRLRLVVGAPVILVDGNLTTGGSTPRSATRGGGSTLSAAEVEGLGQDNHTSLAITKVRDQLVVGAGVDSSSRATTSHALGETLGGTGDADGGSMGSKSCEKSGILHSE